MEFITTQFNTILNTETLPINQGLPLAIIAVIALLALCWLPNMFEKKKA